MPHRQLKIPPNEKVHKFAPSELKWRVSVSLDGGVEEIEPPATRIAVCAM
jgi:hypothetical protein